MRNVTFRKRLSSLAFALVIRPDAELWYGLYILQAPAFKYLPSSTCALIKPGRRVSTEAGGFCANSYEALAECDGTYDAIEHG